MKKEKLLLTSAVLVGMLFMAGSGTALADPFTFVETFNGTYAASGGTDGSAFSGGLDNTGWTGYTSGLFATLDAGGGFGLMTAGSLMGGAGEVSMWRTIGAGDNEIASLDATGSGGVQAIKGTAFSWIFRDDALNAFQASVNVLDYDDIRLRVGREKTDAGFLTLLDIDMTDNGLGNAPVPDPTDIHKLLLEDWTVTWDQATTEWGFTGTVTHKNDSGDQTFGSYTQFLVMTTGYEASEQGRTMKLLQQYDGLAVGSTGYGIPFSAIGLNEVSLVPVPGAVLLGILGLSVAGIKLRKFA